jgi:hypothetical protein
MHPSARQNGIAPVVHNFHTRHTGMSNFEAASLTVIPVLHFGRPLLPEWHCPHGEGTT